MKEAWLDQVHWTPDGLVPAVAQERDSGSVLTLAWMNRASLRLTFEEGYATYWSRSRRQIWRKGETSGHWQKVHEIWLDCDDDALLLRVAQQGVACHTGQMSCFHRRLDKRGWQRVETTTDRLPRAGAPAPAPAPAETAPGLDTDGILERLTAVLQQRLKADPSSSYVASLYRSGLDSILQKVGEEATETIIAAKSGPPSALIHETADLWFHSMVLLVQQGLTPAQVLEELESRLNRRLDAAQMR